MENPEHETIICINSYDGMTPAQRKEVDKGLPSSETQDFPPFFMFGTSRKRDWNRMLRKVGKKNLIRYTEGDLWYEGLIPIRFFSKMSFGIRKPKERNKI